MRSLIGRGTTHRRAPDGDRTVFWATFGLLGILCVGILLAELIRLIQLALRVRESLP